MSVPNSKSRKSPSTDELVLQFFNKLLQLIVQHRAHYVLTAVVPPASGLSVTASSPSTGFNHLLLSSGSTGSSPGTSARQSKSMLNRWFNLDTTDVHDLRQTLVQSFREQKIRGHSNLFVQVDIFACESDTKSLLLERWRMGHVHDQVRDA